MAKGKQLEKVEKGLQLSPSERFKNTVMRLFNEEGGGNLQIPESQKRLISNYFFGIDLMLKTQEQNRVSRNARNSDAKYNNDLPYTWENVDMPSLAIMVVDKARMGLDILLPDHVHAVPYKDYKLRLYKINLMNGYNGIRIMSERYAADKPKSVSTELVYENDHFKVLKKNVTRNVESYEFEIVDPFNRGDIIGGFGYIEYEDASKNKLVVMTLEDIIKRKPQTASAEFWGGTKKVFDKVSKRMVETETDGWYKEMCEKTLKREVYSSKHIPLDNTKVDDVYMRQLQYESDAAMLQASNEAEDKGFVDAIDVTPDEEDEQEMPVEDIKQAGNATEASDSAPKTPSRSKDIKSHTKTEQAGKKANTSEYDDESWMPTAEEQLEMPFDL